MAVENKRGIQEAKNYMYCKYKYKLVIIKILDINYYISNQ